MVDYIAFPQIPAKLRDLTGGPGATYRQCYNLALDGRLPTERRNGRLYVRRDDLPKIMELLGLAMPADCVAA